MNHVYRCPACGYAETLIWLNDEFPPPEQMPSETTGHWTGEHLVPGSLERGDILLCLTPLHRIAGEAETDVPLSVSL